MRFLLVALALAACAHVTTAGRVSSLPTTPAQTQALLPVVAKVAQGRGLPTTVAAYRVGVVLPDGATIAWYVVGTESLMAIDAPPLEASKVEEALAATRATAKEIWNQAVLLVADGGT